MRVTILTGENRVSVEGMSESVDCSSCDGISVVQWYGDHGEIEFLNLGGTVRMNEVFDDCAPFQHLIEAWEVEAKKNVAG